MVRNCVMKCLSMCNRDLLVQFSVNEHYWAFCFRNSINIGKDIQTSQDTTGCQHSHTTHKGTVQHHASKSFCLHAHIARWSTTNGLAIQNDLRFVSIAHFFYRPFQNAGNICVCVVLQRHTATFAISRIIVADNVAIQAIGKDRLQWEHCSNIGRISVAEDKGLRSVRSYFLWASIHNGGTIGSTLCRNFDSLNFASLELWRL
mmetsp:Transcript_34912/g.84483  ORF Transcript_34912/g.84483 Transcript_34912/m.84483 type:complete len:203 (+) Transcript_34912:1094-1702(+)